MPGPNDTNISQKATSIKCQLIMKDELKDATLFCSYLVIYIPHI